MSEFTTDEQPKAAPAEGGSWWSNLAASASHFAQDLEKSIMDSAAAAQSQMDAEAEKIRREKEQLSTAESLSSHLGAGLVLLPWETADDARSILVDPLMERVLGLAIAEEEFAALPFDMKKSVPIILKVLEIDKNLARMHARLSPRMDEELFWRNYFMRVKYLRAAVGIDGPDMQATLGRLPEDEVIYTMMSPPPAPQRPQSAEDAPRATAEDGKPSADEEDEGAATAVAEEAKKKADEQARREEAARLEAEVLAELNEELESTGSEEDSPTAVVLAAGVADVSLEEEDDDAALEAMIAKELGEDSGEFLDDCDDEDLLAEFEDDDEDLDFS